MTTNILKLQQLTGNFGFPTNADWIGSWTFRDTSNALIDLTGIAFHRQVRVSAGAKDVVLDLSTTNGLLINNGATGVLSWDVPAATIGPISANTYETDLIANADGYTINLNAATPALVNVTQGVTTL